MRRVMSVLTPKLESMPSQEPNYLNNPVRGKTPSCTLSKYVPGNSDASGGSSAEGISIHSVLATLRIEP